MGGNDRGYGDERGSYGRLRLLSQDIETLVSMSIVRMLGLARRTRLLFRSRLCWGSGMLRRGRGRNGLLGEC